MKRFLFFLTFFSVQFIYGQSTDELTLQSCYDSLIINYPVSKQTDLYHKISALKLQNLNSEYLPTFNFVGQTSIQSDAPHLALKSDLTPSQLLTINSLGIPDPALLQYKMYLELNQIIWDGGMINARKEIEKTSATTQVKSIEIELYIAREKVNMFFFNLIFIRKSEQVLQTLKNEIENRIKTIQSSVSAGMVLESNLNIIQAELLKVEQLLIENNSQQKSLQISLGEIIHRIINNTTELVVPQINILSTAPEIRPELELYDLQTQVLDKNIRLMKAARMPKILMFGQGGYGRPGLNMLSDKFAPYGLVGIRLNWNIFDWNQKRHEIQMIELQREIIFSKKETYSMNQRIALNTELNNIEKYQLIIDKDKLIIDLRNTVSKTAASRFDNGSINSTDYLIEKNAEVQARINYNLHQIQLVQSQLNYKTISGKKL